MTLAVNKNHQIHHKIAHISANMTTGERERSCEAMPGETWNWFAWKRLCTTLNLGTLASGVKAISNVMNPPRITDPKKADLAIEIWEDRIGKLDS